MLKKLNKMWSYGTILGSRWRRTLSNTINSCPQNETKSTAGSRARLEFIKFDLMMWLLTYAKFDMTCWSRAKLKELLVEPNTLKRFTWLACWTGKKKGSSDSKDSIVKGKANIFTDEKVIWISGNTWTSCFYNLPLECGHSTSAHGNLRLMGA